MARNLRASALEARPEPIIAVGNTPPAGHLHPLHRHRRNQVLYASTGVMVVGTAQGTWVVPPLRAVWIPGGIDHEIRMIGDVSTRSVYLKDGVIEKTSDRCQVLGVSPLLGRLLTEAVDLPVAYEADERANHIMRLIILELRSTVELPLNVPIPAHARLQSKCRRFLAEPDIGDTIDDWAAELHMSRRAFTRLLRQDTCMSFLKC